MATSSFNIGDLNSDIAALNSKIYIDLIDSAVDLNTLLTTDYHYKKYYTGNTCANLTNCPVNAVLPWQLEVGCLGTNINYQYQEFRLYQSLTDGAGSKIYRRQKYYYGVNDFRWNNWVCIDNEISSLSGGVPVRTAGVVTNNQSFQVPLSGAYSVSLEFALVCLNIMGNSISGVALLFLGKGNEKVKDLIGNMSSSGYTASYSNGTWTITNKSGSDLYYTIIGSKLA